jgi:beta-lactam-binding protein with PASTA domain
MPSAGWSVALQATVGLLVSNGPATGATVPALLGTDPAGAADAVTAVGLKPVLLTVELPGEPPGQVFAQFPDGGTQLAAGYPVVVMAAAGPAAAPAP